MGRWIGNMFPSLNLNSFFLFFFYKGSLNFFMNTFIKKYFPNGGHLFHLFLLLFYSNFIIYENYEN